MHAYGILFNNIIFPLDGCPLPQHHQHNQECLGSPRSHKVQLLEIDKHTPNVFTIFGQKHNGCVFASGKNGSTPTTFLPVLINYFEEKNTYFFLSIQIFF